jgi:Ca2+-binding RTX toxin-like protein
VFGALDFETVQFYDIVVRAVDLYGGIYEETVHIDITDVEPTIFGTPDNDDGATNPMIFGTFEEDTIFGLGGDDFIAQSPGSDDIDGGEGNDAFLLLLGFGNYTIVENPDGSVSFSYEAFMLGPSAGTDTVRAVELFADINGVVKTLSDFVNDDPTAAATNAVTTDEDVASAAVAIGAVDADGDALLYAVKTGFAPAKGSVNFSGDSFVYTPNLNANGADSFVIEISDGNGGTAEQTVAVTIVPVNDTPLAEPDTGSAGENETKSFVVLDNDTDPDLGDSKTLVSIGAVSVSSSNALVNGLNAASALSMAGGQIQFSPGTLFDPLDGGETATVTVNYTMRDGAGVTSSSVLTLTIDGAADAPVFNVINGTPGNDRNLNGTAAADQINGFAGDDDIGARGGNDLIIAGAGRDTVSAGGGNDTIVATINDGNDDYDGGMGIDTADYSAITAALNIELGAEAQGTQTGTDRLESIENAIGGSGNDRISGNGSANILDGGAGNDRLHGHGGNDILIGGLGNDVMSGGAGDNKFVFGPGCGNDRIEGFDANPVSGQDRIDISAFGITGTSFFSRVAIDDVGPDTLVTIDGLANQTIRLVGVSNAMTVTVDDFMLL